MTCLFVLKALWKLRHRLFWKWWENVKWMSRILICCDSNMTKGMTHMQNICRSRGLNLYPSFNLLIYYHNIYLCPKICQQTYQTSACIRLSGSLNWLIRFQYSLVLFRCMELYYIFSSTHSYRVIIIFQKPMETDNSHLQTTLRDNIMGGETRKGQ